MASGTIKMMCPNLRCRAVLGVPTEARGRTVRCRNCGCNIKIPKNKPVSSKPVDADASADASASSAA